MNYKKEIVVLINVKKIKILKIIFAFLMKKVFKFYNLLINVIKSVINNSLFIIINVMVIVLRNFVVKNFVCLN